MTDRDQVATDALLQLGYTAEQVKRMLWAAYPTKVIFINESSDIDPGPPGEVTFRREYLGAFTPPGPHVQWCLGWSGLAGLTHVSISPGWVDRRSQPEIPDSAFDLDHQPPYAEVCTHPVESQWQQARPGGLEYTCVMCGAGRAAFVLP